VPTIFHLVRHAQYDLLGRVLAGRTPGLRLNAAGEAQAQALARALAGRGIAAVLSSPRERARETAAPIASSLGLAVEMDEGFDEVDFGAWTGLRFDELADRADWRAWNLFRSMTSAPGGETMLAVQARAVASVLRLRAAHDDGEVVVVSHGDVVKAVLAHALAVPLDLFRRIEIAPASRSVMVLGCEEPRVTAVNLPPDG
jgi:broad specificity phosphatase PhoE